MSKKISIEAKKIEIIKDWPKPKVFCNIQVFLSFVNFYWQFIQSFNRIAAPLTSMLKTNGLLNEPASSRNDGSRSTSGKNNNNRLASGKNDGNSKVNEFGVSRNGVEFITKSGKLSKLGKFFKSR